MLKSDVPKLAPRRAPGPAITVVMPTYRRAHAIGETIRTLLNGTWSDFELLVRDDGDGTDGTKAAVEAAADSDPRVIYHRNEGNLGMPGNLNAGIPDSRGEFIAVCHDHDIYKPVFLERMIETLRRHPTALFVHCAIESITVEGDHIQTYLGDWPELTTGEAWLKFMLRSLNCPVCALTLVRRAAHEKYGLYDPSCGFIADVEMWMRLSSHGDVAYVKEPLIGVRGREQAHVEAANDERWIRTAAEIHRRFISTAFTSSERPLRRFVLEMNIRKQYIKHRSKRILATIFR